MHLNKNLTVCFIINIMILIIYVFADKNNSHENCIIILIANMFKVHVFIIHHFHFLLSSSEGKRTYFFIISHSFAFILSLKIYK